MTAMVSPVIVLQRFLSDKFFADYTLIWDQRFVRTLKVYEPMSYDAPTPIKVPKVTQAHLNEVSPDFDGMV